MLAAFALSVIVSPAVAQEQAQPYNDSSAVQDIIRTINGWRIEQGLWPLRENTTLDKMAYDQASYVLSLPKMPEEGAIHIGKFGEMPPTRAQLAPYNWPSYGAPQYTAVGEIAYTGYNAVAAQHFWEGSPIHKQTALNPAYREIGAAAIPQRWGHLYLVDFGARPDVLPATVDMSTRTLYLSNERYSWARSPWIRNALKIRLFDSDGRPLDSDWEAWKPALTLPSNAGESIYVEYSDESGVEVLAPVSLHGAEDAALPTDLPTLIPTPTLTPTLTTTPTPTNTPSSVVNVTPTPSPTSGALIVSAATASPTATSITTGATPNVLLLYDARSFTLINSTHTPINVSGVVFVGQKTTFVGARWSNQWLSGTLTALAGSDCLEIWSWLEQGQLPKPSRCRQRRGVLTIAPEQLFWKQGDFQVQWGDSTLATCRAADTQCVFAVPS